MMGFHEKLPELLACPRPVHVQGMAANWKTEYEIFFSQRPWNRLEIAGTTFVRLIVTTYGFFLEIKSLICVVQVESAFQLEDNASHWKMSLTNHISIWLIYWYDWRQGVDDRVRDN